MDVVEIRERLLRDESIRERITNRAFEIYASRGYIGGREFEDWLQAESEILPELVRHEQERMMGQAALEPEVQSEESVSAVGSREGNAKSGAAKGSGDKAKKTTGAKKASTQSKSAGKKTSKSTQA